MQVHCDTLLPSTGLWITVVCGSWTDREGEEKMREEMSTDRKGKIKERKGERGEKIPKQCVCTCMHVCLCACVCYIFDCMTVATALLSLTLGVWSKPSIAHHWPIYGINHPSPTPPPTPPHPILICSTHSFPLFSLFIWSSCSSCWCLLWYVFLCLCSSLSCLGNQMSESLQAFSGINPDAQLSPPNHSPRFH